jgi:hypothetical protein
MYHATATTTPTGSSIISCRAATATAYYQNLNCLQQVSAPERYRDLVHV